MVPSLGVLPPAGNPKQPGLSLRILAGEELRRPEQLKWKVLPPAVKKPHASVRSASAGLHAADLGKEDVDYLYPDRQLQGLPLSTTAKRFGPRGYSTSATMAASQPGTIDHAFTGGDLARGQKFRMNHSLRDSLPPVARENRALARLLNEHDVRGRELEKLRAELLKRKDEEAQQRRDYHKQAERRNAACVELADEIRNLESQIFQREMIRTQLKRDIEGHRCQTRTPQTARQPLVAASDGVLADTKEPEERQLLAQAPLSARPATKAPISARTVRAPLSARTVKAHIQSCTVTEPVKEFGPSLVAKSREQAGKQLVSEMSTAESFHKPPKPSTVEQAPSAPPQDPSGLPVEMDVASKEYFQLRGEIMLL